ncbi:MAG: HD domain-containing protein [Desulfatibacillaceae bacterium]|nr:HD domain-containing protein [Desulfatibacillaceae bacterium]
MSKTMCPGQDTAFWTATDVFDVACAQCGHEVEFFKDDAKRRCRKCGNLIGNPRLNLGCAQWCEHAKECLGYDPKEGQAGAPEEEALLDRLIAKMKGVFGNDQRRITHALTVLEHAQKLLAAEKGANPKVVLAAAVLHDVGIPNAEKKHNSSAGRFQEIEGPPVARAIMDALKLDEETADHVEKIIANHHSAKDIDTIEFRILWDADWLVNLPEEFPDKKGGELEGFIEKLFKTQSGKNLAKALYL